MVATVIKSNIVYHDWGWKFYSRFYNREFYISKTWNILYTSIKIKRPNIIDYWKNALSAIISHITVLRLTMLGHNPREFKGSLTLRIIVLVKGIFVMKELYIY